MKNDQVDLKILTSLLISYLGLEKAEEFLQEYQKMKEYLKAMKQHLKGKDVI